MVTIGVNGTFQQTVDEKLAQTRDNVYHAQLVLERESSLLRELILQQKLLVLQSKIRAAQARHNKSLSRLNEFYAIRSR